MKIQTPEKVVDDARPLVFTIDAVEDIACCLHRQRRDFRTFAARGDRCHAGGDAEAYRPELAQFVHHRKDLFGIRSSRVKHGLGVVQDYEHLLGGKEGSQRCKVLGVFDPRTDDLGESGQEVGARSGKLIAADESTVPAKPFLDPIVVKDGECDRRLSNPPCTNESDGFDTFSESNDLLDELAASETVPRRRRRGFTKRRAMGT